MADIRELLKPAQVNKEPAAPAAAGTVIVQPNSVTFADHSFSRMQLQIYAYVMKELQCFITPQLAALKAKDERELKGIQLSLFTEIGDCYYIKIPKKLFVKSCNYRVFAKELEGLSKLTISYKKRNPLSGKISDYITNVFSLYADGDAGKREVTVELKKDTVQAMCLISMVADPKTALYFLDYYTSYTFEILLATKKQYTGLLYLYCCSWRNAGGWRVPTAELKRRLGIDPASYAAAKDFKKHVLDVASAELKALNSPLWFEGAIDGNYTNIKIITTERAKHQQLMQSNIIDLLKRFGCNEQDIDAIRDILDVEEHYPKLREIMAQCATTEGVNRPDKHVIGAIKKWHANFKRLVS